MTRRYKTTSPETPILKEGITHVQQIMGGILYYTRAMNLTMLTTLSTIVAEQVKAIKTTIKTVEQLLDYLATHPDATMHFQAFDTVLSIHWIHPIYPNMALKAKCQGIFSLDGSPKRSIPSTSTHHLYPLQNPQNRSGVSGGSRRDAPSSLLSKNLDIHTQQPPSIVITPPWWASQMALSSSSDLGRWKWASFYVCDQVLLQKLFDVQYHPGLENLGDYYSSKHHDVGHHIKVRPVYLLIWKSPLSIPQAPKPSNL